MSGSSVLIAGAQGMVGSAVLRRMRATDWQVFPVVRAETDFMDRAQVDAMYRRYRPDWMVLAAARVGGITANNSMPADFAYQNLMMQNNLIDGAYRSGTSRVLFLGSSCIYPRLAPQPMSEDCLLTGALEPTNEPYAIAKIAGIKLCESYRRQYGVDYRSLMPTNLYGPEDNFHPEHSHVLPALMQRLHDAARNNDAATTIWGSGNVRREFLHVDDLADAIHAVMCASEDDYWNLVAPQLSHLNVGTGEDLSIRELATAIAGIVGFEGTLEFDRSKPDGTPRKLLDVAKIARLGWRAQISLSQGLERTYAWFLSNRARLRH